MLVMNRPPNLRFWTYAHTDGGPVKLTLKPGQGFGWTEGGPHEEGYCWTHHRWEYTSDPAAGVREQIITRGRCCDGPHESYGDYWCPASQLLTGSRQFIGWDEDGNSLYANDAPRLPNWTEISSEQRDHFAEAAGY